MEGFGVPACSCDGLRPVTVLEVSGSTGSVRILDICNAFVVATTVHKDVKIRDGCVNGICRRDVGKKAGTILSKKHVRYV